MSAEAKFLTAPDLSEAPMAGLLDNRLLAALPSLEQQRLLQALEPVALLLERPVYEPNAPIEYVYFPTRGIISIVNDMEGGTVEVGTVGREGMVGVPVLLRSTSTPTRAFVQVAGSAYRLPAEVLRATLAANRELEQLLLRYVKVFFDEVMQSVACNRLHSLEERCAKWLLMCHDRAGDHPLLLRQTFLAEMLGVHRPSVSIAAGALQRAGFISYSRGKITVLDRAGLESASCGCYAVGARGYATLHA